MFSFCLIPTDLEGWIDRQRPVWRSLTSPSLPASLIYLCAADAFTVFPTWTHLRCCSDLCCTLSVLTVTGFLNVCLDSNSLLSFEVCFEHPSHIYRIISCCHLLNNVNSFQRKTTFSLCEITFVNVNLLQLFQNGIKQKTRRRKKIDESHQNARFEMNAIA